MVVFTFIQTITPVYVKNMCFFHNFTNYFQRLCCVLDLLYVKQIMLLWHIILEFKILFAVALVVFIMSERINSIIEDIKEQYLEEDNNIPWIIGFSGGKDSTAVLTLVWLALNKVRDEYGENSLSRPVYVVNNDTLVENPIITDYLVEVLDKIKKAAVEQRLPIYVQVTLPRLEDSFWISFLGKGYPVPNNTFRWCTERLKIKPTTQFILDKVDSMGEAIVLIGTRKSESATRAKTLQRHEIKGKRLTKHPISPNAYNYAPIKELYYEEVWWLINNIPSPWGYDNSKIYQI